MNTWVKAQVARVPVLGPLARRAVHWLRAVESGGLSRKPPAPAPSLSARLLELADLRNPWSGNYTKPVDEAYVLENQRHHAAMFALVEKLAQRAAPHRPPRVLEVGMGLGTMCIAFSRRNFDVTGLDFDALQVARAQLLGRTLGGFASYMALDLFHLRRLLQPDTFDVAFSQGTLEHLGPGEVAQAFHEQLHVAPYVVWSVPSVDWPDPEVGRERRMTTDEWRVVLRSAGVEPIALDYYGERRWHVLGAVTRPG